MDNNSGFFVGANDVAQYLVGVGKELMEEKQKAEHATISVDGVKMFWNTSTRSWGPIFKPILPDAPRPASLKFFTLDGFIAYVNENTEGMIQDDKRYIVQVVDEKTVVLLDHPSENSKKRYVIAECEAHTPDIIFERYLDTERFNTMLLSTFIDTDARKLLFTVVKSMTKEQNLNTTDDGVSQVITVKQGVSTAANVQFQNPVPLKPMRTFSEVDQPESNFTLRVSENAECALFESDGGAWKNEAVSRIAHYVRQKLYASNVVVMA